MMKKNFFLFGLMIFSTLFFFVSPVFSAAGEENVFDLLPGTTEKTGLQASVNKLETVGEAYGKEQKTLPDLVGGIIKTALTLLGVIFLILTVYGGYKWMIARGDAKEVEVAKDTITRALIGLIVILAAYAITYFVVYYLTTKAGITAI